MTTGQLVMVKNLRVDPEKKSLSQSGFNLTEVMIATTIFSSLMIMCLSTFTVMFKVYFKGVNENKTLGIALAIVDDVSTAISSGGPDFQKPFQPPSPTQPPHWNSYCVGGIRYYYSLGKIFLVDTKPNAGLMSIQDSSCQSHSSSNTGPSNARQWLDNRMRLTKFEVEDVSQSTRPEGRLFSIELEIVYGGDGSIDTDCAVFVCSKDRHGALQIDSDGDNTTTIDGVYKCKQSETFCSVVDLKTKVFQR